ncbi:YrbL family protein [Aliishimia ponticola]|nr:YrbL family protein [Aliishimia ponticola]
MDGATQMQQGAQTICLDTADKIRSGAGAMVFWHPNQPGSLIKITRPPAKKSFQWLRHLFESRRRRFGAMYLSLVELEEYMLGVSRKGEVPPFMPEFRGVVQTNLGPGLVFEAIQGPTGDVAETVLEYAQREGMTPQLQDALYQLFSQIAEWRLVAWDINPKNIVVVPGEGGSLSLFLVDGLGERTFIRVLSMSDKAFRRDLDAKLEVLTGQIHKAAQAS